MTQFTFERAIDLIHAYSGAGDELERAFRLGSALSLAAPLSGYGETVFAEALSTWELNQNGEPLDVADTILALCDKALDCHPQLAQAHVAKARTLLRRSMHYEALSSIEAALAIDPGFSGALFLRAELARRTGAYEDAAHWYAQFIESAPTPPRKSNGYAWLARTYQAAAANDPGNREALIQKARFAYEAMLQLDPHGAWKNVNFAIFLNDQMEDFKAAEHYALRALQIMEFPMARYHLAAARYQGLDTELPAAHLVESVNEIEESTRVSLSDAIEFDEFSSAVRSRLEGLMNQVASWNA